MRSASAVHVLDSEALSPLGAGTGDLLNALRSDTRAGTGITRFDAAEFQVNAAAEVRGDLEPLLAAWPDAARAASRYDRKLELALACASRATRFRVLLDLVPPTRRGVVLGGGIDVAPVEKVTLAMRERGATSLHPDAVAELNSPQAGIGRILNPSDLTSLLLARYFGCEAFQETVLTACSASAQALGLGCDAIRSGDADMVLVGGADSLLNVAAMAAFAKLGVVQPSGDDPAGACRPCDRQRRGTLLGEGAGLMLLASPRVVEAHALLPPLQVVGHGNTLDGYHLTNPDPSGDGMRRAMETALRRAGMGPDDIDYVNLHGTGTRANDEIELAALHAIFGDRSIPVMASSTKDRHGHLIAAAGILEAIVVSTCMINDLVPRTVNLVNPVASPGVDLVMGRNRQQRLTTCMSNSFAFGGINTSLIFKRTG